MATGTTDDFILNKRRYFWRPKLLIDTYI